MPRYVVERTFAKGMPISAQVEGAHLCLEVVDRNADEGVTWLTSYVSNDKRKTFCVYDGPSPECEPLFSQPSVGRRTPARALEREMEARSHPESQTIGKITRGGLCARRFSVDRARMVRCLWR